MNIPAALFSDLTLLIVTLISILIIGTARFIDFLLGETGTTKLKPHLVDAYVALGEARTYSAIFRSTICRFGDFLQTISGWDSSPLNAAFRFFSLSLSINIVFTPWLSDVVDSYTGSIISSPNYMRRSYVPYYYHVPLALTSVVVQSAWDTISILFTYYIVRRIQRSERGLSFVLFDIASVYFLWSLTVSLSIYSLQIVSNIGWRCFGVVVDQLEKGAQYQYLQCTWNDLIYSSDRVSNIFSILKKTLLLEFSYPMLDAGDPFSASISPILLMSATTLWPTAVYLAASAIVAIGTLFLFRTKSLSMLVINRLDEQESGLLTKVATFIVAVLAVTTAVIKLTMHLIA